MLISSTTHTISDHIGLATIEPAVKWSDIQFKGVQNWRVSAIFVQPLMSSRSTKLNPGCAHMQTLITLISWTHAIILDPLIPLSMEKCLSRCRSLCWSMHTVQAYLASQRVDWVKVYVVKELCAKYIWACHGNLNRIIISKVSMATN